MRGQSAILEWRRVVCVLMIGLLPLSVLAEDRAILRSGPGVSLNRNPAPAISAIVRNDLIETQKNAIAYIQFSGSQAIVEPETMVQFEGDELALEHGSLSVDTAHGVRVRVGCVTVTPVNPEERTRYDVRDTDGKVTVSAEVNDVFLGAARNSHPAKDSSHSNQVIVRQGDEKSRGEKCGGGELRSSGVAATRGALDSPLAVGLAAGAIGVLACMGLCHHDDPISPTKP